MPYKDSEQTSVLDKIIKIVSKNNKNKNTSFSDFEDILSPPEQKININNNFTWRWFDFLIIAIIVLLGFISVIMTMNGFGLSWDEAYYYEPSQKAATWLEYKLFGSGLLSKEEMSALWDDIWELPSIVKLAIGTSYNFFNLVVGDLIALRLPSALAFSIILALIYSWSFFEIGRFPALFSSVLFALTPRMFGHAHIAATETISSMIFFMTIIAFRKGTLSWVWSILFGVLFGIALATKINAFFLPVIFLPYAFLFHKKNSLNNLFAMLLISPVILILVWPWLYENPFSRIVKYLSFHANHQLTALYFFGKKYNYGLTPAPSSYPLIITLLTVPAAYLFFCLLGALRAIFKVRTSDFGILILWAVVSQIGIASLPLSPKYDGERLFIGIFPYLSILGGMGFYAIINMFSRPVSIKGGISWRDIISVLLIIIITIYGVFQIIKIHPYELSYFNEIIGGLKGADYKGMEITYWGESINEEVIKDINNIVPKNAKLMPLALHGKVFLILQEWGVLRDDIQIGGNPPYDYHLLLNRKGFFMRPEWCLFLQWTPIKVYSKDEVPFVLLYKTGAEFETQWQNVKIPLHP